MITKEKIIILEKQFIIYLPPSNESKDKNNYDPTVFKTALGHKKDVMLPHAKQSFH